MIPTEKGPKSQQNLLSRPADVDSQDGGTCKCGYSLRLTREVLECIGKVLDEKLSTFTHVLDAVSLHVEDNTKRITEMERQVSDTEDNVTVTENKLREAEKLIQKLYEKVDDLENKARWDNNQVLGLKEGSEGSQPVAFFSSWLPKVLGLDTTKGHIKVDSVHRSLGPQRRDRPRPVLIKLHNFSDKQHIMSAIKAKRFLEVDGREDGQMAGGDTLTAL
ncbi:hypothetical protein QTP86_006771 [Hemibagrus guttatus]|nr:hypothetical protein QTP86_006771 [Hemibagrus guttatus]